MNQYLILFLIGIIVADQIFLCWLIGLHSHLLKRKGRKQTQSKEVVGE